MFCPKSAKHFGEEIPEGERKAWCERARDEKRCAGCEWAANDEPLKVQVEMVEIPEQRGLW